MSASARSWSAARGHAGAAKLDPIDRAPLTITLIRVARRRVARHEARAGMIVADALRMSAHYKSRVSLLDPCASETTPRVLRVPCPGEAHRSGATCLVCDEEDDGTISIVVTDIELAALECAAHGQPFMAALSRRLYALGLLHDVAGLPVPTERGRLLLGGVHLVPN